MKYFKYSLYLALLLFMPMLTFAASKLATVQVKITGISNNQGVVRIAMFNMPQAFAEKNNSAPDAFQKGIAQINEHNQATYIFKNVPYGVYAIKLFHDEDNSGKLKKNLFGKPQEGFGFSNNPPIAHQAPSFDQAKFAVDKSKVNMTIQMVNPS
jgi:uncharacterized protein (DUF2141 family)